MLVNAQNQRVFLDRRATDAQRAECREILTPEQPYHGKMFRIIERLSPKSIGNLLTVIGERE